MKSTRYKPVYCASPWSTTFLQKISDDPFEEMPSTKQAYKSAERIEEDSSDEESLHSIEQVPSPSKSPSLSPSPSPSPVDLPSSSNSVTRTPSPDPSTYQYVPPTSYQLSTSKERSVLPKLSSKDDLYLLRVPRGVKLDNVQFNLEANKARIRDEEWKLVKEEMGDIKLIQPKENSEKYEFGWSLLDGTNVAAALQFTMGLNVVRDVQISQLKQDVRSLNESNDMGSVVSQEQHKKRKRDDTQVEKPKRRDKDKDKKHTHKDDEIEKSSNKRLKKDDAHKKEKRESHEKEKKDSRKKDKEGKRKNEKHSRDM